MEDQTRDGPTTPIREGPREWVGRNRVSLHNTRKILKNTRIMGKIVGKFRKIPEKKGNIVGIFWEIPKKKSKNSRNNLKIAEKILKIAGRTIGYSHDWESVPTVRTKIPTVRTKIPMLRRKFPHFGKIQINSIKFK